MSIDLDTVALAKAMNLVYDDCDNGPLSKQPIADIFFIHGVPTGLEDDVLAAAAEIFHRGKAKDIVINGLEVDEVQSAYCGAFVMEQKLNKLGIRHILKIRSSVNTVEETEAVIKLASERECKSAYVISHRYHILRVMCQWDYCLRQVKSKIKVYARSIQNVDWEMRATKVLLNGEVEDGTTLGLFAGEIVRIARYADLNCFDTVTGKRKYTPNSTIEELLAYYKWRDEM